MGLLNFLKLFRDIDSGYDIEIRKIYNLGYSALSKNNLPDAIKYFEQVENQHRSAAYNLGLIYLNGENIIMPDYNKARYYFQLADKLGHDIAKKTAFIIGFEKENRINPARNGFLEGLEYMAMSCHAVNQFKSSNQCGNLGYMIANEIIVITESSSNQKYTIKRFIDYEIWYIRNICKNKQVLNLYNKSILKNYMTFYDYDWEDGEISKISEYINDTVYSMFSEITSTYLNREALQMPRIMGVNHAYSYFVRKFGNASLL